MKDLGYGVGGIILKHKRIKSAFVGNTEIAEDIISHSTMLMLPESVYTKTAGTVTLSVGSPGFASER